MEGVDEHQLLDAMRFLLTPARTREMLVQWSKEDRILVLPFNDHIIWMERATGDDQEQASLLSTTVAFCDKVGDAWRAVSNGISWQWPGGSAAIATSRG